MKTRERLNRIRQSKSWVERQALAEDLLPGTRFDWVIPLIIGDLAKTRKCPSPDSDEKMRALGEDMATNIAKGNSQFFRELADALDIFFRHKTHPDKIRLEIISFCAPPNEVFPVRKKFSVRKIVAHLRSRGIEVTGDTPRIVRRICAELNLRTDGKSGAPKKADTKQ